MNSLRNPKLNQNFANSKSAVKSAQLESICRLDHIHPLHWQEWLDSGIDPEIIGANLHSLDGSGLDGASPYDYLCYADNLPRTNSGRLANHILRRYRHTEAGGWWCQGLDPLNGWEPMLWGCFKPDLPIVNPSSGKPIKYEHPLKLKTRAFFLDIPSQPSFWPDTQTDPNQPILIVEGAKKAAALLSQGYAAIALPGVFNGRRVTRDDSGRIYQESLIPELLAFAQAGRPVYFCFDHDSKPNTVRQVNLAIAATGKLLQDQGCEVQVVTLPGPEKGVDDFLVAQGAEAFAQVYEAALPLNLWLWQHRKTTELTLTPSQIVSQKEFQPTNLPDEGILILASAKGTGKTKSIVEIVKDEPKVIALGHRIALMRNLCDRMNLDYRADLDEWRGQAINSDGLTHRIGLCVDSLGKINPADFEGAIVVIDEFMQVLRHLLLSATCNQDGKRPALLAKLSQIIQAAKLVVLADADAADVGINYFQKLAGSNSQIHLIRNDYQPEGFDLTSYQDPKDDAIVAAILEDIRAGRRIFVSTDSLTGSEALQELIKALKQDSKGLIINSKTSGEPDQRDFITNPNAEVHRYNWIIATPSLSTGVSIEVEHFEKVYGLFYGVITDADAAQALNRVRANVPRAIWAVKQGKNFSALSRSTHPNQILQTLKTKTDLNALVLKASLGCADTLLPELFNAVWQNNTHIELYGQLVAHSNQAMWSLRDGILARLQWEGNRITLIQSSPSDDRPSPMKEARKLVKQAHFQAVATAKILTKPELDNLERKEALSPGDQLDLEKTHTAEFLAQESISSEDVEFCTRYRASLLQLEVLIHGPELSVHRDVEALNRQVQWGHGFLPFDQPNYELKRFVRDRLGLLPFLEIGREWNDQDLEPLAQKVRQHRQQVKEILGFTVPEDPKYASNGWIFQVLCHQLGLKVNSRRRGRRGEQIRYYTLDGDHYNQVMGILDRRHHRRTTNQPEIALEPVATPSGLNNLDGVNYEFENESQIQAEPPDRLSDHPKSPLIQVSDRVKTQIKDLIHDLNLFTSTLFNRSLGDFVEAISSGVG
jgi:hypothetical protein